MKTTLTTTQAADLLIDDKNANWTRAGAFALVEHLEAYEEDTGDEIYFCAVTLRCDFAQYKDLQEWAAEQWGDIAKASEALKCDELEEDDFDEAIRMYIIDRGTLLEFDEGIIVSSF